MNNINLEGVLREIQLKDIQSAPEAYHFYIKGIGAISASILEYENEYKYLCVLRFTNKERCIEIFKASIDTTMEECITTSLKNDILQHIHKAFNQAILKYFIDIQVLVDKIDIDEFVSSDIPFEDENAFEKCKQFEYENCASYYSLTTSKEYAIVGIISFEGFGDFGIKRYTILKVPVHYYNNTFSNNSIYDQLKPDNNVEILLDMKLNEFAYGIYTDSQNERELVLDKLGDISFDIETSGEGTYRKFRDTFLLATIK